MLFRNRNFQKRLQNRLEQRKSAVSFLHRYKGLRRISQGISALLLNLSFVNFFVGRLYTGFLKSIPFPAMNCYACPSAVFSCPIGTISHFFSILKFPFLAVGLVLLPAVFFGRWICGWVCPFGLFQEVLYKIPSFKFELPKFLRFGRYVSLVLGVVVLPLMFHEHFFCMICPVGTVEAGIYWVAVSSYVLKLAGAFFLFKFGIAFAIVYLSIFTKRPFCRFLCPLGALFSLFNSVSLWKFSVEESRCRECLKCEKVCPVNHRIFESPNSGNCIRCLDCVKSCEIVKVGK